MNQCAIPSGCVQWSSGVNGLCLWFPCGCCARVPVCLLGEQQHTICRICSAGKHTSTSAIAAAVSLGLSGRADRLGGRAAAGQPGGKRTAGLYALLI